MEKSNRAAWIKGPHVYCNVPPASPAKPFRLVLLGAPGVGKGTQAQLISERLGACQLSTGDVFRAATKGQGGCDCSPAMSRALEFMRSGQLVPDETVLALVEERGACLKCRGGFLLDGFPRTLAQAEALEKILAAQGVQLDGALSYELPLDTIVARLAGRRVCSKCKVVYHVDTLRPKLAGVCDCCGATLYQREDDRPQAIRVRMEAYETSTAPLTNYYRSKGLLISISAEGTPEEIFERTLKAMKVNAAQLLPT